MKSIKVDYSSNSFFLLNVSFANHDRRVWYIVYFICYDTHKVIFNLINACQNGGLRNLCHNARAINEETKVISRHSIK